jgi:hypothetical protein
MKNKKRIPFFKNEPEKLLKTNVKTTQLAKSEPGTTGKRSGEVVENT